MATLLSGKPAALGADIATDIRAIIARAIAPQKADRYASAADMANDLARVFFDRADRDGKSVARDWLAGVRDEPGAAEKTNDLFDLGMVLTPSPSGDAVRRFETHSLGPSSGTGADDSQSLAAAQSPDSPVLDAVELPAEPPPWSHAAHRKRRRLVWLAITGALAFTLAFAAVLLWRSGSKEARSPSTDLTAAGKHSGPKPENWPPEKAEAEADAEAEAEAKADAGAPAVARASKPERRDRRGPRSRDRRSRSNEDDDRSSGFGYAVIGGAGALRAEIRVDGKKRGYAPKTLRLPAGKRKIQLVFPDGRKKTKRVTIGQKHTPSSPFKWLVAK